MTALDPRALRRRFAQAPPRHRLALRASVASLVVWAVVMTGFMLRTPAGDYAVYRALAPAAFDDRALYEVRLGPLAYTYPAFAAAPLSVLATVGFGLGLFLLTAASLAALVRTIALLARAVRRERPDLGIDPFTVALVALAVAVWFAPVTKTLLNGQINLLLLWLVVEDVIGDVPRRWRGVLTGIATGIKLTPGLFLVAMLVTGRRAWAVRGGVTVAVTIAIGFLLEPRGSLDYWRHLGGGEASRYGNPEGYGNQSLLYALVRVFDGDYQRYVPVALLLVVAAMVLAHRLHRQGHELAVWGVTAIAMLAVTPVSWTHHWVWMFVPVAALVAALRERAGARALLAVGLVVLVSSVVSLAPKLDLTGPGRAFVTEPLGNAFLLVGLSMLAWFAVLAFGRPRPDGPGEGPRGGRDDGELSDPGATVGSTDRT